MTWQEMNTGLPETRNVGALGIAPSTPRAIYVGIGYKFRDWIQSVHRIVRYLQARKVVLHIIYAESEKRVLELLLAKWERYKAQAQHMSELMQEYGLSQTALMQSLQRSLGVERVEVAEDNYRLINADAIEPKHLPSALVQVGERAQPALALAPGTSVEEAERRLIQMTLEHTRQNKTRAAEILGISLKTLHNKLNKLKLRK